MPSIDIANTATAVNLATSTRSSEISAIRELANAVRFLAIDAVQRANSGHPGMPLGMADIATVLWREFLRHDPSNPRWQNRDRFILSNGHGSMLQYALLHLSGYDLTINDLKQFRQLHSKTPGHPECGGTVGIEATTGPLGQGLANAVGMALAEKILAAQFNRPEFKLVDHYTYVFVGDGCLMEGVSHEACSFAGTHRLGKLIVFWDDNGISIDGRTNGWFTDNTPQRFLAYGWQVIVDVNGHDAVALRQAITNARNVADKPTLICCKTTIGFGAPNVCGKHDCHGAPLGPAEITAVRKNLNWPYPPFVIPDDLYIAWDMRQIGKKHSAEWQLLFRSYQAKYPELAAEFSRRTAGNLPTAWVTESSAHIEKIYEQNEDLATRKSSQNSIEAYAPLLPELIGGSADLTASNLTNWSGSKDISSDNSDGNYLHYGVREFGMFAIMNGFALHGGFIPYGGTFLVFSDYGRNAIRLAAMMQRRVIFVLSHDSIGLGEDGPTHQPIEHVASLRLIPHLSVWRPCDAVETAIAWKLAIERSNAPTCLILSRQKLLAQKRSVQTLAAVRRGGYVLFDGESDDVPTAIPECILIASGSEVNLAVKAAIKLHQEYGNRVRVVSMPSIDVFEQQDAAYRNAVLPQATRARVAIEAGSPDSWYKYVGDKGKVIGISRFGESAPEQELFKIMGLTVEQVVKTALSVMELNGFVLPSDQVDGAL